MLKQGDDDGDDAEEAVTTDEHGAADESDKKKGPIPVEYYLVFIFQTWEKRGRSIQFVPARYRLASITASFYVVVGTHER